ncbi:MAG: phosphate signaling complex protein PhoU [Firmicutes bacterium]|nr:phosphate signaling complex protein PhoU [Bacillota bacterium]
MVRANFERDLQELHNELIEMGGFVESAIEDSIEAFKAHDTELCRKIIENDKIVDTMEKRIEAKCLWLIAREQPVASDLRQITTALKMTTDIERIGDHASDIAELILRVPDKNAFSDSGHIPQMAAAAIQMVHDAVTAYVDSDLELAGRMKKADDVVDDYFNVIKQELVQIFATQPEHLDHAVDLLLIAKYLERIGDHAVNICEWVQFSQTGAHKNTPIF